MPKLNVSARWLEGLLIIGLGSVGCGKKSDHKTFGENSTFTPGVCSTEAAGATDPTRRVTDHCYASVGMVTNNGRLLCSGLILRHGVFVTAKHCYRQDKPSSPDFSTVGIIFPDNSGIYNKQTAVKVKGSDVRDLRFDGDGNDITYIIYDPAVTKDKIGLDTTTIIRTVPAVGTHLNVVGFPSPNDDTYRRLVTSPCQRQDREGTIGPKPVDEGYDGQLYDTNCGAWFGNSGGPFFMMDSEDPKTIKGVVGVVSHTFDTDAEGNILSEALSSDDFGKFVKTVNFSPFSQAKTLDEALAEGQE